MTDIRNWFSLPYEEQQKHRPKLVLVPDSYLDTLDTPPCDECDGSGKCDECHGTGEVDHFCDCEFCHTVQETCPECKGKRDCPICSGTGLYTEAAP